MRALVKQKAGHGSMGVVDREVPEPGAGQVRVRITQAGVCRTDVHLYDWPPYMQTHTKVHLPVVIGHEAVGVVDKLGSGVDGLAVGGKVGLENRQYCGHCFECRTDNPHLCENVDFMGLGVDGYFADYVVVPANTLFPLPADVEDDLAVLLDPFALAVRGCLAGSGVAGHSILITGCGPLGLLAAAVSQGLGARGVVATESHPSRLAFARKHASAFGIDVVLDPGEDDVVAAARDASGRRGVDVWMDYAGSDDAIAAGFLATRPAGEARLFAGSGPVTLDPVQVLLKEINVQGFHGRRIFETWYDSVALLRRFAEPLRLVVTDRLPLSEFEHALDLFRTSDGVKVVLEMEAGS